MHIVHALFTPSLGGIEQAFINISRVLTANGHEVTCLMREDAPYAPDIRAIVANTCYVTPRGFYDVRAMWRIRRQLKRLRPDIILSHAPRAISLMGFARMGLNIPLCGMLHSYRASRVKRADQLVVLTEHMRHYVIDHGFNDNRVNIVTNMITIPEAAPLIREVHSPFTIATMGRLVPEKGFDRLIDAVAILCRRGFAVRLYIGGTGPEEDSLRQQVQTLGLNDIVIFEAWVKDKETFFSKVDMFCLPSLEESFGIVLLEAMVRGLPIVATDAFGPSSIFTSGKDALLVPKDNAQALAGAIEALMASPEKSRSLAQESWRRVQDFSVANVSKQWEAVVIKTAATKAGLKS